MVKNLQRFHIDIALMSGLTTALRSYYIQYFRCRQIGEFKLASYWAESIRATIIALGDNHPAGVDAIRSAVKLAIKQAKDNYLEMYGVKNV